MSRSDHCFRCGKHMARFCVYCVDDLDIGQATYAEVDGVVDLLRERGLLAGGPGVLTATRRAVLDALAPEVTDA